MEPSVAIKIQIPPRIQQQADTDNMISIRYQEYDINQIPRICYQSDTKNATAGRYQEFDRSQITRISAQSDNKNGTNLQ